MVRTLRRLRFAFTRNIIVIQSEVLNPLMVCQFSTLVLVASVELRHMLTATR